MTAAATGESDLLIVGGGPAGCAAALRAAQLGRSVTVLVRGRAAGGTDCAGVANRHAIEACRALDVDLGVCGAPFAEVTLRSWDFAHEHVLRDEALAGVIVDPARLRRAMHAACRNAGVVFADVPAISRIVLGERDARVLPQSGEAHAGRVLLVADGVGSDSAVLAQLAAVRGVSELRAASVAWRESRRGAQVTVFLGPGLRLAIAAQGPEETRVALLTRDLATPARRQLEALLATATKRGFCTPRDAVLSEQSAIAGAALDLDAHVGKRCLLIGGAGGFAAALSGEGLYPSIAAAAIAVQTAAAALEVSLLQDALAGFGAAWRGALAGYLAPPSTDLSLLMPMLFQNPQMARRTAGAILLGDAF